MKKTLPYLVSLLLTVCCFSIHMSENTNSMLNNNNSIISNDYLSAVVEYHNDYPAFKKRPINTFLIKKTVAITGVKLGQAFIIINLFFLFLSGVLVYHLSQLFAKNNVSSLLNILFYFICFSNLFVFFKPIYTYDEPLQFCLIFLSLIALYREKWMLFILTFSLSLITRESGLILLPALLLIVTHKEGRFNCKECLNKKSLLKISYLIIPVFVYLIFLKIYLTQNNFLEISKSDFLNRFSAYDFNLQTPKHALESLISLFLIIGLPLYFLYNRINQKNPIPQMQQKYISAFLVTIIINSVIVLLTTQAREARLFVIPLFFIWPIFTNLFLEDIKFIFSPKNYILVLTKWKYVAFFIFLNFLNYIFSFKAYTTTLGRPEDNYFNEYLFITLFIVITHAILKHSQHTSSNKT